MELYKENKFKGKEQAQQGFGKKRKSNTGVIPGSGTSGRGRDSDMTPSGSRTNKKRRT